MIRILLKTLLMGGMLLSSMAHAGQSLQFTTQGGLAFAPVIDLPANLCVREITHESLYRDMVNFKQQGWDRVYVIVANPGCPFYANPWISMMSYAEGQPNNQMRRNYELLGDPNAATVAAAKKAGLEIWAVYKPYEGGGYTIPHTARADGSISHLPTIGGMLVYKDAFLSDHPEFRLKRRPEVDASKGQPIHTIEIAYMLDTFSEVNGPAGRTVTFGRLDEADFTRTEVDIYISQDNGDYELLGSFMPSYRVEERTIYDPNGFVLLENSRSMIALIEDVAIPLDAGYFALVHKDRNNKRLIPQTMIKAFTADGSEAPLSLSRFYRFPYFSQWQADRPANYEFGRETVPASVWRGNDPIANFQQWGFVFDWYGASFWGNGWVINPPMLGVARGKLEYLKGNHCEGYPEVRAHWMDNVKDFIEMGFDGIDFRLQNHSGMISDFVNYGFNAPIVERYNEVYGVDLTQLEKIDEDTAIKMMKVRGSFFMEFLEEAIAKLHAADRRAKIHLRYSNENPTLDFGFNEMGFWAMPRIIIDWQRAIDLADEVTLKDYYHNNFRKEMSAAIKQYAYDQGKRVWAHAYYQQGREANVEYLSEIESDPHIDGVLGYEFYFGAGTAIRDSFTHALYEMGFANRDGQRPALFSDPSPLIAYEGFSTLLDFTDSGSSAHYFDNHSLYNRRQVVEGTIGFPFHPTDESFHWVGSSRFMRTFAEAGLQHEGVDWHTNGGLAINSSTWAGLRRYARKITAPIQQSDSYYMSVLIATDLLSRGSDGAKAFRTVGFTANRGIELDRPLAGEYTNLEKGIHVGVEYREGASYLVAFANGQSYKLAELDADMVNKTIQVVLKLAVNKAGDDYLTAWYAPRGASHLSSVLSVNAVNVGNVWQSTDDLGFLIINMQNIVNSATKVDEIHFGTTLSSVTKLYPN